MVLSRAFLQATAEERKSQGVRVDLPSLLLPMLSMFRVPGQEHICVIPGTSRASVLSHSQERPGLADEERGSEKRSGMFSIPNWKRGRSQPCLKLSWAC